MNSKNGVEAQPYLPTYNDDCADEGDVCEEGPRFTELRRASLKLARVIPEEDRIQDQAQLRTRQEEWCKEPPYLRYALVGEDLVCQPHHVVWAEWSKVYCERDEDSGGCNGSGISDQNELPAPRHCNILSHLVTGGEAQNASIADILIVQFRL